MLQAGPVLFAVRYQIEKKDYHEIAACLARRASRKFIWMVGAAALLILGFSVPAARGSSLCLLLAHICCYILILALLLPLIIYLSLRISYRMSSRQMYRSSTPKMLTTVSFTEEAVILEEADNRIVWPYGAIGNLLESKNWYLLCAKPRSRFGTSLAAIVVKKQYIPPEQQQPFQDFIQVKTASKP